MKVGGVDHPLQYVLCAPSALREEEEAGKRRKEKKTEHTAL